MFTCTIWESRRRRKRFVCTIHLTTASACTAIWARGHLKRAQFTSRIPICCLQSKQIRFRVYRADAMKWCITSQRWVKKNSGKAVRDAERRRNGAAATNCGDFDALGLAGRSVLSFLDTADWICALSRIRRVDACSGSSSVFTRGAFEATSGSLSSLPTDELVLTALQARP